MNISATNQPPPSAIRASVLIMAMVLAAFGTLGVAAWVSIMAARGDQVEALETALDRRVRQSNSKAMARQYVAERVLCKADGALGGLTLAQADGWAQVTSPGTADTPLTHATATRYHQHGALPATTYSTSLDLAISDGRSDITYRAYLDSYVPAFGGELLTVHSSAAGLPNGITGSVLVNGKTVIWRPGPGNTFQHRTASYAVSADSDSATYLADLSDTLIPPGNAPFAPRTTGAGGSGLADLTGSLSVINNAATPINSYAQKLEDYGHIAVDGTVNLNGSEVGYDSDGSGLVTVELGDPGVRYFVVSNVSQLLLEGAGATSAMPAMVIVVLESSSSPFGSLAVNLNGDCERPLILAVRQEDSTAPVQLNVEDAAATATWRGLWEFENAPVNLSFTGAATSLILTGGIRTDSSLNSGSGTLQLEEDTSPSALLPIASRTASLELYRN